MYRERERKKRTENYASSTIVDIFQIFSIPAYLCLLINLQRPSFLSRFILSKRRKYSREIQLILPYLSNRSIVQYCINFVLILSSSFFFASSRSVDIHTYKDCITRKRNEQTDRQTKKACTIVLKRTLLERRFPQCPSTVRHKHQGLILIPEDNYPIASK